jgi:hypothetical protein
MRFNNLMLKKIIITGALFVALTSSSYAHGGIYFYNVDGRPALGYNNDPNGISAFPDRVTVSNWNWSATAVPGGAFTTSSPSWSAKPREGDKLSFKLLTSLQKWDDSLGMFVDSAFDARISYTIAGTGYLVISNPTGPTQGFEFAMTSSITPDYWHIRHSLNAVGQSDPNATGIYRLNYEASRTFVTSVDDSVLGQYAAGTTVTYPAFGMLFNRGVTDTAISTRAFNYARDNVVPEPMTLLVLASGITALVRSRRAK